MVRPTFLAAAQQFFLSEAVALALHRTLLHYGIDATLKWPNDIYVGSCKLAGVLVELDYSGCNVEQAIIGIGLNVNQTDFPAMDKRAVSMKNLLGQTIDREQLLSRLLHSFLYYYNLLAAGKAELLHADYKKHLLGLDECRSYRDCNGSFEGVIVDVEPTGYLLVRRLDGSLSRYAFKEVEQII
jgi:BirA family biotin operon repressor/biotin-[acetyl-CoA-carboxylase] ligase